MEEARARGVSVGDKRYSTVLLEDLPSHWFGAVGEATKGDVFRPGVSVLQESCSNKDSKKAILKTSCSSGVAIQPGFFPNVKATVMYQEYATISLSLQEPSYVEVLGRTAAQFGVQFYQAPHNHLEFNVSGNLDMLVDFRKAFDKELLLACAADASGRAKGDTRQHHAVNEHSRPFAVEGASTMNSASALGAAATVSLPDSPPSSQVSFPSSKFESFENLNTDVLTIMSKIPDGKIPGLHYAAGEGVVYIQKDVRDRDDSISKFQRAYQESLKKLKKAAVDLPVGCSDADVTKVLEDFHTRYSSCIFSLTRGDTTEVNIISTSSRQLETAKKLLLDQLSSCIPEYTVPLPGGRVLTLKRADIVAEHVDAIVNAANGSLEHGGGVARAIDRASGGAVQQHSKAHMKRRNYRDLDIGSVASTQAGGSLKCKHVLHAVGPRSSHHDCENTLKLLMRHLLNEAKKMKLKSIAIPAISSGIFGVDKDLVAHCIIDSLIHYDSYPKSNPSHLSDIRVVIIDQPTYQCFVSYGLKNGLFPLPAEKKTPSASKLETSIEKESVGAKGSDVKKAEDTQPSSEPSSEVQRNSELAGVLQLLFPIASKWKVLATTLGAPQELIASLSALPHETALEQLVQQWWHANPGLGPSDRREMLITALGNSDVGEGDIAVKVWEAYSAQYPSEVPPISNNTPVPSDINRTVEEKSEDDSSTPYGTPPTSDVDMAAAATDVAKLQADVAALAISGTTSTALATGDGTHFNDPADKNYGRSYSDPIGGPATTSADRLPIPQHVRSDGSGQPPPPGGPPSGGPPPLECPPPGFPHHGMSVNARSEGHHQAAASAHDSGHTTAEGGHGAPTGFLTTAENGYGAPTTAWTTAGGGHGAQTTAGGGHGAQTTAGGGCGAPTTAGGGHRAQTMAGGGRGAQTMAGGGHGAPTTAGGGHGAQTMAGGGRGAQTMAGGGRGAPTMAGGGHGAQTMAGGGRGAPTTAGGGRGAPTMAGGGRGAPTTAGGGRGAPTMAGHGHGAQTAPWTMAGGGHGAPSTSSGSHGPQDGATSSSTAVAAKNDCSICLGTIKNRVQVLCGHEYCKGCIRKWLKDHSTCPICQKILQPVMGNQPPGGVMTYMVNNYLMLPGYRGCGTIEIEYAIPDGTQSAAHPHPGRRFQGAHRKAYLPNNKEGTEVVHLLRRAFDAGLIFTVGTSHTTGQSDVVVWNDIHHKTSLGSGAFGYPDPTYLRRVKEELAAKGIQ